MWGEITTLIMREVLIKTKMNVKQNPGKSSSQYENFHKSYLMKIEQCRNIWSAW